MNIKEILDSDVFEFRTIKPGDIQYLYKPFSELTDSKPEENTIDLINRNKKIAVRGWRGNGKSCLINYVTSLLDEQYFPIEFPIWQIGQPEKICSDKSEFILFMLTSILNTSRTFKNIKSKEFNLYKKYLSKEISYTEGNKSKLIASLKQKFSWIPGISDTTVEVSGELEKHTSYAIKEQIYTTEHVRCIKEIIEILQQRKLTPVFVFDDTDKFLQFGKFDITGLVDKFFVHIVPLFREFDCPIIFPTHESYLTYKTYEHAENNILDDVILLPDLDETSFCNMLDHKLKVFDNALQITDLFEQDALSLIFEQQYIGKTEERMRNSLRAINGGLNSIVSLELEKVDYRTMVRYFLD